MLTFKAEVLKSKQKSDGMDTYQSIQG